MPETRNQTPPPKTQYKPRKGRFFILGIILFSLSLLIVFYWTNRTQPKAPPPPPAPLVHVATTPVSLSKNNPILTAGGFISARFKSQMSAEVSGKVIFLSPQFSVGQQVKKGDILLKIDPQNYRVALASAEANLADAKSHYAQEQAKARQARKEAKAVQLKPNDLLFRVPQLAAAKEKVRYAKAQRTFARNNVEKTKIKAPFDAIIKSRNIAVGDNANVGVPLGALIDTTAYTLKLTLNSIKYHLVETNNPVVLTDTNTGAKYHARIDRLDPAISDNRTIGAYVDIKNPRQKNPPLLLNSYLTARITGRAIPQTMWINNDASIENQFVWVKKENDKLHKVKFTLFYRDKNRSLVRFNAPIQSFVSRPKADFFEDEKVQKSGDKTANPHKP